MELLTNAVRRFRGGCAKWACGRGWWTSGRRLREVVVRRGGGFGPCCSGGPMGQDRDLTQAWVATLVCEGSKFVDPAGSAPGNAKVDLVATPGRRPRNMVVLVATWMKTAWAEGSSTMTGSLSGNAKVDMVASPGRRPWNGWCVFGRLVSCGRRVASSV